MAAGRIDIDEPPGVDACAWGMIRKTPASALAGVAGVELRGHVSNSWPSEIT